MRVFLTGGTGFVGAHVALALRAAGHSVRALRRPEAQIPPILAQELEADRQRARSGAATLGRGRIDRIEWIIGSLLDPESLHAAIEGCDAIVHAAADLTALGSPAARAHQRLVNVEGTRHIVEAALAHGVRRTETPGLV